MAAVCGGTDVSTAGDLRCVERWELESACMTPLGCTVPFTLSACSVASMTNKCEQEGCQVAAMATLFSVDVQVCSEGLETLIVVWKSGCLGLSEPWYQIFTLA